jgi:hypothetical protein
MLASLLYSIVRLLVDLLSVRDREQAELPCIRPYWTEFDLRDRPLFTK